MHRAARAAALALAVVMAGLPAAGVRAAEDPLLEDQWSLHAVGAPDAWETSRGESVTIALVDTGVDLDHEDLVGQISSSVACIGTLGDPARCAGSAEDDDGHGTHVAGLLAATAGNGRGGAGMAPAARLMVIRALRRTCVSLPVADCHGYGTTQDVSAALRWAVDHGAHVINLSWAEDHSALSDGAVADAVAYAWSRGVIAVMASGNDAGATDGIPRQPVPAIVVTGTTGDGERARYANAVDGRARWALAAPGGDASGECPAGDILSTFTAPGGEPGYGCLAGTSMASPHVAGAAALLRSLGLSAQETVDRLLATARDVGSPGPDSEFGAGIVDAAAAVAGIARRPGGPGGFAPPPGAAAATSGDATGAPSAPSADAPEEAGGASPSGGTVPASPEPPPPPATTTTTGPVTPEDIAGAPAGGDGNGDTRLPWALAAAVLAAAVAGLQVAVRRRVALRPRRRG